MRADDLAAVDMLRAAIATAGRHGQVPPPVVVSADESPLASALMAGESRTVRNPHPLLALGRRDTLRNPSRAVERPLVMTEDELNRLLVQVPRPAVNGSQMACVSAHYAREESPAIAHFAAAHWHVEEILRTVGLGDPRVWILGNIDRLRGDLAVLERAMKAHSLPTDVTGRDGLTRRRPAFVGTSAGPRQLHPAMAPYDFTAVYRPAKPRKTSQAMFPAWQVAIALAFLLFFLR